MLLFCPPIVSVTDASFWIERLSRGALGYTGFHTFFVLKTFESLFSIRFADLIQIIITWLQDVLTRFHESEEFYRIVEAKNLNLLFLTF